jgi:hypothetical protein
MEFKIRGKVFAIANSSDTLLSKVAASLQNGMVNPEDDARVAYALVTACPTITPDIASYQSASNFKMTLDSLEISRFMIALNVTILERSKVQNDADKTPLKYKIIELKRALVDLEKGLTPEQVKIVMNQVQVNQTDTESDGELKSANPPDEYEEAPLTPEQQSLARMLLKQYSET